MNYFKTTVLMAGLMGLCMAVGYAIGGPNAMLFALIIGGFMNFFAYFFSDKIALMTMRAQQIQRQDDPELWDTVDGLCQKWEMPMPKVYISPAAAPNAFATGRNPHHAAVCVTAGLREMLNRNELAGVIAHELGHVKNRDILISTIAAVVAGAITYLAHMAQFAMLFGGGRRSDDDEGANPLVMLLVIILAPIAAMLIQLAISRSREYAADRKGAELCGSPKSLARALEKLAAANSRIPLPVSNAQASMFIVTPLTGQQMAGLFMTHPPIEKRIEKLMEMENEI